MTKDNVREKFIKSLRRQGVSQRDFAIELQDYDFQERQRNNGFYAGFQRSANDLHQSMNQPLNC